MSAKILLLQTPESVFSTDLDSLDRSCFPEWTGQNLRMKFV